MILKIIFTSFQKKIEKNLKIFSSIALDIHIPKILKFSLLNNIKKTNSFLKSNTDIIVTQADKTKATVLLNKQSYIGKMLIRDDE